MGDVSDPQAPGNVWRTAAQWPPVPTTATPWYLHADHALAPARPGRAAPLSYLSDPANPVPSVGGLQLTIPAGGMDQRKIESRPDVLVFTSAPLDQPIEVTGRVRVKLWITSDAPDTDFVARLCDVYPDGRSFNVCEGQLRARFRKGFDAEHFLKPGEVYPLEIDLWSTSIIFNRGHCLRVHVASTSAPGYDPNPQTGDPFRSRDYRRGARNVVYVDRDRPSHIVLPVAAGGRAVSQ
jgi:putative CocE/NonD family hydrolase